jgi:hypothetical protein
LRRQLSNVKQGRCRGRFVVIQNTGVDEARGDSVVTIDW